MPITFPDLPYAKNALEPHIGARTLEFHHGKHHKGYVDKTNAAIEGTDLAGKDLEAIVKAAAADPGKKGLFNNAAQAWNHAFFWQCMKAGGGGKPSGKIAERIEADFGGYAKFVEAFKNAGTSLFGSGWAWLVKDKDTLKVIKTGNADTPIAHGFVPLLTLDVWEHAYYLDYQNRRDEYIKAYLEHLVNWEFAEKNLG